MVDRNGEEPKEMFVSKITKVSSWSIPVLNEQIDGLTLLAPSTIEL